uniref:Arsenite methyltransferase n=1 Tax=Oncorhynchus kisutch TaxID=8019 RepID=A0A8C7MU25_ONCKI
MSVFLTFPQDHYGKTLKKTSDLKSNACLAPSQPIPAFVLKALKKIHPEVTTKYYGCGLVVPDGRDCYMLSQLVGEKGHVTGIDMTEDQLHNCVVTVSVLGTHLFFFLVNFSPDKRKVLSDDGGELYFSDVYSSRKLSDEIKNHNVLWGECLVPLAQEVGFSPPRLVTANVITVDNMEQLEATLFVSATYRLFKVPKISNKGSLVIYNGNITGFGESLEFDAQYTFKVDEVVEVDGEVASILSHYRFAEGFTFQPPGVPARCGVKKHKVCEEFTFQPHVVPARCGVKKPKVCEEFTFQPHGVPARCGVKKPKVF